MNGVVLCFSATLLICDCDHPSLHPRGATTLSCPSPSYSPSISPLATSHPIQVRLPPGLGKIGFGYCFNQPIDGVNWPRSLVQLNFGGCFNQPVVGVKWPVELRRLTFGFAFNQPVDGMTRPPKLNFVSFDRQYLDGHNPRTTFPESIEIGYT